MPLVRIELRNEYGLGVPEMYREANREEPKEILEGVAVAGLVGVLRQLGDLSDFAAQVFHGLQEEFTMTSSRSRKLMGRIRRIEAAVSPFEKVVLAQRSHLHFAYEAGFNWRYRGDCENDMFVYADAPQFILDAYEDCHELPRLDLLDRFDPSGPGSCLKRYSDPLFFKKASAASGEGLEDKKGSKIKKLRSLPRNGRTPPGALVSNHGSSMLLPCQTMYSYDATLRSDLSERSNFDLRNGSGYINSDFRPSYSVEKESSELISSPVKRHGSNCLERNAYGANIADAHDDIGGCCSSYVPRDGNAVKSEMAMQDYDHHGMRQEDDHHMHAESISRKQDQQNQGDNAVNFEAVDTRGVQSCIQDLPKSECVDVNFDEFDTEKDIFMDSPNAIELEDEIDITCMGKQDLDSHSYSESNGLVNGSPVIGGGDHNPISVSLKSSFATFCCISSCISGKNGCDLVQFAGGSYGNGGRNAEHASCSISSDIGDKESGLSRIGNSRSTLESQKPAPETSDAASFSFWTNGGLLGLQPSIPPDCGIWKDLAQDNHEESSWSFRKMQCKISPADLGIQLGRTGSSVHENNASFGRASLIQAGSVLPVAAKNHPEDSRSSSRIFELDNRLLTSKQQLIHGGGENSMLTSFQKANAPEYQTLSDQNKDLSGHEPPISSPCSSPPLRHMKISFQPIDGFETSRLKLKFPCGITNDESCRDILPSFQLVPDVSIAQQNGESDSDDDTFYRSSPSLLDGCHGHQSGSDSEQWASGESPTYNDPDSCNYISRISCMESVSTVMDSGRTSHGDKSYHPRLQFPGIEEYTQSSRSFDLQSLMALNHTFQEELRNDTISRNIVEPEFATTTPGPSPIPPVQWYSIKPNLDYAFNLKDSLSNVSQQPKPAPLDHDNIPIEQNRKNSNGNREADTGKSIDEKEDFLQLIRSKSFNLRPTMTTKPAEPSKNPPSVHITAILTKANAIRQAVGSDDAEDNGDGNWSDT